MDVRPSPPPSNWRAVRREVLPGSPEALLQFLAGVPPHEQGDEGTDSGAVEAGSHLIETLVDGLRIELAVELLVDEVPDIV